MAIINKPYTFSPNTSAASSEVNSNFDTIYNDYNGGIAAANLASDAVTTVKIADDAVTSSKIADGTITSSDISSSAAIPFSKLSLTKSDITGLGIPGVDTDTTYSAGTGLSLNEGVFSIESSVVTSNYGGSLTINGALIANSFSKSLLFLINKVIF